MARRKPHKILSKKVRHGRPFYSVSDGKRVRFRYTTTIYEVTTSKRVAVRGRR